MKASNKDYCKLETDGLRTEDRTADNIKIKRNKKKKACPTLAEALRGKHPPEAD